MMMSHLLAYYHCMKAHSKNLTYRQKPHQSQGIEDFLSLKDLTKAQPSPDPRHLTVMRT